MVVVDLFSINSRVLSPTNLFPLLVCFVSPPVQMIDQSSLLLTTNQRSVCFVSTNQRLLLYYVNQSEITIVLCQPIRDYYCIMSTNQIWVLNGVNQSDESIYLEWLIDEHAVHRAPLVIVLSQETHDVLREVILYELTNWWGKISFKHQVNVRLSPVNQSEISIVCYQPIRDQYYLSITTNQKIVFTWQHEFHHTRTTVVQT